MKLYCPTMTTVSALMHHVAIVERVNARAGINYTTLVGRGPTSCFAVHSQMCRSRLAGYPFKCRGTQMAGGRLPRSLCSNQAGNTARRAA